MNYISINNFAIDRREVDSMYRGQYFDWLCEKINLRPGLYDILISHLHSLPFTWIVELDSNRAEDGLVLRGEFHANKYEIEAMEDMPCSVLEALIGLALKMDYILDDDDKGDRTRIWFWEMIDNLGLDRFTDSFLGGPFGKNIDRTNDITEICQIWLNREFDYSGNGSPFPLKNPHDDQRRLHMMAQLNEYILENYMFEDELL